MSSHDLDLDNVQPNQPNRQNPRHQTHPSTSTISPQTTTASRVTILHGSPRLIESDNSARQEQSPASQSTVVPYAPTPPPAPTPPSIPSDSEVYGPQRLWGHQQVIDDDVDRSMMSTPPGMRYDQPQFPPMVMVSHQDPTFGDFKDDLARAAGVVTPGVDDGPYIRHALDALTSRNNGRGSDEIYQQAYHFTPTTVPSPYKQSSIQLPSERIIRDNTPRDWPIGPPPGPVSAPTPTAEDELREKRQQRQERAKFADDPWGAILTSTASTEAANEGYNRNPSPHSERREERTISPKPKLNLPRNLERWQARSDLVIDPETGLHNCGRALDWEAPLTLKPWVLRPQSLLILAALCLLMVVALIVSAVYSMNHNGLTPYAGTIHGGQYFLFRMLPQLIAIIILIYAQCVITAAFWVLPFSAMASDDRNERRGAMFLPLYPKSFLWPQLGGAWNIWIPIFNVWLLNFTIPLQSSLFTVILVDGNWVWATVQGVAWTLVALYVSFMLSLVVLFVFWNRRRTGMMQKWGIRTLGDIIFLISQSNSLSRYRGLETAPTRSDMRQRLQGNADRLGFWFSPEVPEIGTWYGIGMSTSEGDLGTEKSEGPKWAMRREGSLEAAERSSDPNIRDRYLPWCFRDSQITLFVVASSILLLALVIVSFLHSTDLRNGFLPLLSAMPVAGAFSAADFVYSFIPSLLGLILFLLFQSLDLTLRILAPWGELSRAEGSRAETSLLLDYATCLPFESTYKALRNKHWRVAFVSLLSPVFALLPVLGGGLFLALTPPDKVVRMYPNVPAFAIILTLLFLYVAGLVCLIPSRGQFRLPHAVTCLAEVISFCTDEKLRTDGAFDLHLMLEPTDLAGHLDLGKDWHRQGRWILSTGRNNDERLGIKRFSKYTVNPKKLRAYDRRARGQLISAPLPHDSGSLFNH
ncbi:uncharacterized protein GGS22DRAFT_160026 [Annulohypoxylon maeteangense]|uniref:uncharacterized protein n=1 Tax=Annulohypoxylon maeteangense TaxID=1927788 RepID=UPI002008B3A0|nr:uncharacterized protein GGS22DRAFT_160026 [Annulohypoxylon maeteangense]KAI0886139.1 hypothetical protein GGS22DRAFT_160026 [Annulohypoxylon maeteangense]